MSSSQDPYRDVRAEGERLERQFNRHARRADKLITGALICFGLGITNPAFFWGGVACVAAVGVQFCLNTQLNLFKQQRNARQGQRIQQAYWAMQRSLRNILGQ